MTIQSNDTVAPSTADVLNQVCARFEQEWKNGRRPRLGDYLGSLPEQHRSALFIELFKLEKLNGVPLSTAYQERLLKWCERKKR